MNKSFLRFYRKRALGILFFLPLLLTLPICADLTSNHTFLKKEQVIKTKPELREENGAIIECYLDDEILLQNDGLKNWGENIKFNPRYVFIPTTKLGICNIVKWATEEEKNLKIRVSGYQHTWNPVYPDDGQILISLLGFDCVLVNPSCAPLYKQTEVKNDLKAIQYLPGCPENNKIYCKIGGAVTNDELRLFCLHTPDPIHHHYWTLPLNTIIVENSLSGTISSICHGAGYGNRTLSDLVEEMEFVNAKGELQVINKLAQPDLMRAAAGSFGLLGVITSITLKLDKMSYALTSPHFLDLAKAIPPPIGTELHQLPEKLQKDLSIFDQETLNSVITDHAQTFFNQCKDYYAEWFWFILSDKCWVNTWNQDVPENDTQNRCNWEYGGQEAYSVLLSWLQNGMGSIFEFINQEGHKMPPPPYQETFVRASTEITTSLLANHPRTLPLPEAIHFQRGIRHIRVRDVEVEIPLPLHNGQPDWTLCQKAWWDTICIIYKHLEETGTLPINLTLEMRIMGGSDITMAAQQGNGSTCSIEVLSNMLVPHDEWKTLVEKILGKWITYKDANNQPLNVRTHWGKEWHGLQFNDMDAATFVKKTHKDAIPKFKKQLGNIANAGGYTLNDMQKRFSNSLWDEIIFPK